MLQRFFIICSGADTDILAQCSKGEQTKYAGIGATVFFTALMAFVASSYALFTVFDHPVIAIGFGIIWGLLIFNLDRYIVSTLRKKEKLSHELLQILPRLVLAFIIAVVISKPLELKLFEKEINQVLLEQKHTLTLTNSQQIAQQYKPKIKEYNSKINVLRKDLADKEAEVNELYDIYISEAEGRAGTKLLGKGPVYEEKRHKHDVALVELQDLKQQTQYKISEFENEIKKLQTEEAQKVSVTQLIITNFDGLMARITALGELPLLPSLFVFLLFLAVETAPILAKLLASKSAYDILLEDQESALHTRVAENVYNREQHLAASTHISKQAYEASTKSSEIYTYKLAQIEDTMKYSAKVFYDEQKRSVI
ncbi:MAG: DUF4407 domain-containing protein [Flavobacteriaceae bacterium]